MAIIPNDEQFIGLSPSVNTTERRSALINAESQAYTMQDITDTVSATIPAPTNPTSGYYPINKNGVFVDSGLSNALEAFGPFPDTGLKFYDSFSDNMLLNLDSVNMYYSLGPTSFTPATYEISTQGVGIAPSWGEMTMGCGISSPTNGVFRASGVFGFVTIGTHPTRSLGVFVAGNPAMQMGSALINGAPSNLVTPVAWTRVRNESGTIYYSPLYQ